ncbi:MAG: signal peptidase I [Candidatus Izemoplasmatales bacterium]|nr:signal peptidase I [Candidatus Izemoplasmatales bacterium]
MGNSKIKKGKLKSLGNVVFWVVLGIIIVYSAISLFSTDDGLTSIFGGTAMTVQSDSMSPTFNKGDLVFIDTDFSPADLEVGDVITFQTTIFDSEGNAVNILNSHRIVSIVESENGKLYFFTKGDNNPVQDAEPVTEGFVFGVWNGKVYSNIGGTIDSIIAFLKGPTGFFIFIVLPCFSFLVYELVRFIKVMTDYNVQKTLGDRVKMQEEALAMAKAQLEAEQLEKTLKAKNNDQK